MWLSYVVPSCYEIYLRIWIKMQESCHFLVFCWKNLLNRTEICLTGDHLSLFPILNANLFCDFLLFRQKQMQNYFAEASQIRPIRGIAMLLPIFWCPSCKPPNAYPLYVLPLSDKLFRTSWPWRFSIFLQPLLPTNNILGCFAPIQNKKPWRRRHSPGYPAQAARLFHSGS